MFSPSSTAPPLASNSNTRRRPRPSSSESLTSQPKAKRQRSALTEQTFIPPDNLPETQEVRVQRATSDIVSRESSATQVPRQQLAVRGKKYKATERGSKDDGSVLLTSNDTYTVSRLPTWPDRLHGDKTGRQHGAIYSDTGYALLLSQGHALVWPYTNSATLETFSFNLPHAPKSSSETLPLGALVSSSASSTEPGLVVVMPISGKVTYWESVASATTMDLIRHQRNGVELSIPGMLSGESVIQILNAESAGFVLGFSSGRLAYMSVRDSQGRPDISVQFLRGTVKSAGGGIFGSLRNVLGSSSWRGDLAAVRAAPAVKPGERDVVSVTSQGRVQAWNLHRGGHNFMCAEAETREAIILAMKDSKSGLSDFLPESFEAFDVAFSPKPFGSSDDKDSEDSEAYFILLVSLSGRDSRHYALVHVALKAGSLDICMVRHIRTYTTPVNCTATSKPRLYLPKPGIIAFLVFDRAVAVVSLARQPDSPNSQPPTKTFEDVINFREDTGIEITGSGMEEPHTAPHGVDEAKSRRHKAKYPAVVLLAKGGGVIRIAATGVHRFTAANPPQVTAKSKLEQAVFYGTLANNPLNFSGRAELQFSSQEIGEAALALSYEIMSSTTPYIPSLPASVEDHLHRRSTALHNLATHLKTAGVALNRTTRWKLLWDAEKIAGARLIWKHYDNSVKQKPVGRKRGLINDMVEFIHERYRSDPVAEAGELDRVRHWFINDVAHIEIAIPWAFKAVRCAYNEGEKDHSAVMLLVSEADDFVLGALLAAFEFRESSLGLYGLNNEKLENGILKEGYEGLPTFWTSTHNIVEHVSKLLELVRSLATEYWKKSGGRGLPDQDLVNKIRLDNSQLVDIFCRSYTEHGRWLLAQQDPKLHEEGEVIMGKQPPPREVQIYLLGSIGLTDQGIKIAEKHKVFSTLVALIIEELLKTTRALDSFQGGGSNPEAIYDELSSRIRRLQEDVQAYYKLYGAKFADALYTYYIKKGEPIAILSESHQQYVTQFLRGKEQYAKVSWIHEVIRERDFDRASKLLLDLGFRRELCLWNKKVELSLGKLSRLAGTKNSDANGIVAPDDGDVELAEATKQLELTQIQDKVFAHVYPAISVAIDEKAELQLAMEVYGNRNLKGMDALARLLEENMSRLIDHRVLATLDLVDLLTLMGRNDKMEEPGLIDGLEFYMALQALKCGPASNGEQVLIQRIIWRRCMIRDDWREINNTDLKDDEQVSYQLRGTALYSTLRACLKNRLFERPSVFAPTSPAQMLDSSTKELDERFKGLDASVRGPIMKDMQAENELLRHYVEKCRLEKWFEGTLDLAKQDDAEEVNEESENGRATQQVAKNLKQMEDQIAKAEQQHALEMLRSKPRYKARTKLHGSVGLGRSSVKH